MYVGISEDHVNHRRISAEGKHRRISVEGNTQKNSSERKTGSLHGSYQDLDQYTITLSNLTANQNQQNAQTNLTANQNQQNKCPRGRNK